jgi:hypothetical protein
MADLETIARCFLEIADGGGFAGGAATALLDEIRLSSELVEAKKAELAEILNGTPIDVDSFRAALVLHDGFAGAVAKVRLLRCQRA